MPKYDDVADDEQLLSSDRRTAQAPAAEEPWVAITTTVPSSVRRQLSVACAVHNVKLKDAVTEALRAWLAEHPPRMG
ncbi:hypothetical protein [Actinomadura keratinilytica]|uniref:CopG family transcriptional regulator n=1 Tax=Actinomadura keratinilytica TaxID=547461 RepID=A0ABP7ZE86_9ACTN